MLKTGNIIAFNEEEIKAVHHWVHHVLHCNINCLNKIFTVLSKRGIGGYSAAKLDCKSIEST